MEAEAQAAARLGAGQRLVAQFRAEALPLLARLAQPGGDGAAPYDGLRALRVRVAAAERLATRRALVERQVAAGDAELAGLRAALAAAAAGFESLCAALGAGDAPAAEARLALAEQRQRQEDALDAALAGLRQAAAGREEASLAAEAAALPPEALEAALAAAGEAARAAADAADAAAREAGSLRAEIDRREAATGAIAARADEQAAAALLGRTLEEALVLQLAGSLLADALKAVEEVDSPALLQRLTRVYQRLTLGVAQQVLTEEAGGGALELRVVEAAEDGRKPVAALSEGSRDQLFLALRLIAIEDHVAAAPPLPFVADDILQSFDDDRALAAFEALLGLSQKVQVVLLTHHEHLVELAGRLPPGSVALQRLERPVLVPGLLTG